MLYSQDGGCCYGSSRRAKGLQSRNTRPQQMERMASHKRQVFSGLTTLHALIYAVIYRPFPEEVGHTLSTT